MKLYRLKQHSSISPLKRKHASSLTELAAGLTILLPLFVILIQILLLIIAFQYNEKVCREMVHMAASGDPDKAKLRAQHVLDQAIAEKPGMISDMRIDQLENELNPDELKKARFTGGTIRGTVKVVAASDIPLLFAGSVLPTGTSYTIKSTEKFPYTYLINPPKPSKMENEEEDNEEKKESDKK